MKAIELLLEEDEIMILRMQARMTQLMIPETNELVEGFMRKILIATDDLRHDYKQEIGKMQRAMRKVKDTPEYVDFIKSMKVIEALMIKEIEKEDRGTENN